MNTNHLHIQKEGQTPEEFADLLLNLFPDEQEQDEPNDEDDEFAFMWE